jgi:hypothetical protein
MDALRSLGSSNQKGLVARSFLGGAGALHVLIVCVQRVQPQIRASCIELARTSKPRVLHGDCDEVRMTNPHINRATGEHSHHSTRGVAESVKVMALGRPALNGHH